MTEREKILHDLKNIALCLAQLQCECNALYEDLNRFIEKEGETNGIY